MGVKYKVKRGVRRTMNSEDRKAREEEKDDLFAHICNHFWCEITGGPGDGILHTCPECREFASEIMAIMEAKIAERLKTKFVIVPDPDPDKGTVN